MRKRRGGEEEGFFKAKSMNEVDAGRERATRHRLDMMTTSLFLPISLHVTVREPLGLLTNTARIMPRHAILAESQPALKVSFNRPKPSLSRPGRLARVCVCVGCLFVTAVIINWFFERCIDGCLGVCHP